MYIEKFKILSQYGNQREGWFYCGDVIKMQAVLNIDTADTATIKIVDPCLAKKVDYVNMTKIANGVYQYLFQSHESGWIEGDYIITIKIAKDGYTDLIQDTVTLHWQEPFGTVV